MIGSYSLARDRDVKTLRDNGKQGDLDETKSLVARAEREAKVYE